MRSYEFPYPEAEQQTVVSRFGGIDCRTHPTKVSLSRSPDMQNMICDQNDFLVKRTGWHTQAQFNAPIYGLFAMPDGVGCAVHAGAKLYFRAPDGTQTELCADMNEAFSQSFTMKGVLYLMDGKTYRAVRKSSKNTAWEAVSVSGTAYVPTTTISAAPTGGGTSYEAVNLLTPKRINTFIGDGTATQFKVDATDLDETAVTAEVNGSAITVSAVNRSTGMVTLAAAPANGNGLANVSIAFAKTVSGHADKINKCRFAGLYGGKNDTRVFLSGNPEEPDCDWQSGLYDPTYFPDTGYTRMGTDASAIVGYLKQYESQVVVKSGGAQEATSYLRTYMMADDGSALYPLKQGAQGEGAISSRCFAVLNDLPLYLSARGDAGRGTAPPLPTANDPLGIRCHCAEIIAGGRPQKRLCGGIRGQILSGSKRTHLCRGRLSDRGKRRSGVVFLGQCACTVSGCAERSAVVRHGRRPAVPLCQKRGGARLS